MPLYIHVRTNEAAAIVVGGPDVMCQSQLMYYFDLIMNQDKIRIEHEELAYQHAALKVISGHTVVDVYNNGSAIADEVNFEALRFLAAGNFETWPNFSAKSFEFPQDFLNRIKELEQARQALADAEMKLQNAERTRKEASAE